MPLSPGSASESSAVLSAVGPGLLLAEVRVLGAVLRVQELVADAAEAGDVDAGAELAPVGLTEPLRLDTAARSRRPG